MKTLLRFVFGLFLALVLFSPASVLATDYFIDPSSGNDANNGQSLSTAWKTLQKANRTLRAGDAVYLRAGNYTQSISPVNSGSENQPIVYSGYADETATITRGTGLTDNRGIFIIGKSYINIQKIRFIDLPKAWGLFESSNYSSISDCYFDNPTITGTDYSGLLVYNSSYITINNNRFIQWGSFAEGSGDAVRFTESNHVLVDGNNFSAAKAGHSLVGSDQTSYIILRNNILQNTWQKDIDLKGSDSNTGVFGYFLLEGNQILDATYNSGVGKGGVGVQSSGNHSVYRYNLIANSSRRGIANSLFDDGEVILNGFWKNRFYNNTFVKNQNSALQFVNYGISNANVADNIIKNNIFVDNGSLPVGFDNLYFGGMAEKAVGAHLTIDLYGRGSNSANGGHDNYKTIGNLFYQTTSSVGNLLAVNGTNMGFRSIDWWQANYGSDFSGNLNSNPLFVDYNNRNYTLGTGSPAIDQATPLAMATFSGTNSVSLPVSDAQYFVDGYNLVSPDWIKIGSTNPVQISSINYDSNVITLKEVRTWNQNDPIRLYQKTDGAVVLLGSANDLGAYEYQSTALPPSVITPAPEIKTEDINRDGSVNISDINLVITAYKTRGTATYNYREDVNKDNQVNAIDYVRVSILNSQ